MYPPPLLLAMRLLLGGAFLAAGLLKVSDPAEFASAIASFQLVPPGLVPLTSVSLPFFEIILGAVLVSGFRLRTAAFTSGGLLIIYIGALASALVRGLPLECDCFGSATLPPLAPLRDAALLAAALVLYLGELKRDRNGAAKPHVEADCAKSC